MAEATARNTGGGSSGNDERAPRRERLEGLASYLADPNAKEFDRLVYERIRLGILSALSVSPSMSFSELKQLLETSDGNLSVHARKLENAGYIACNKTFQDRLPRTEYKLTGKGLDALSRYLNHMESLIDATRDR